MGCHHSKGSTKAKAVLEHFPGYHVAKGGNREGQNHSPTAVPTSLNSFFLGKLLVRLEFEFSHLSDGTCPLTLRTSTCCCISTSANQNTLRSPRGSHDGYSSRKQKTVQEHLQELPGTGSWVLLTSLSITNRLI